MNAARLRRHGQRPGYEPVSLPTCGDCRFCEALAGASDRCAIDGRRVQQGTDACESYVTVRRGP